MELKKSKQKPNSSIGFGHPGFDHSIKVGVFEQLATTLCLAPCLPVSLLKNPMKLFQINEKNVHVKPNKTNQNRTVSHNSRNSKQRHHRSMFYHIIFCGVMGSMTVVKYYKMAAKYYTHSDFMYLTEVPSELTVVSYKCRDIIF